MLSPGFGNHPVMTSGPKGVQPLLFVPRQVRLTDFFAVSNTAQTSNRSNANMGRSLSGMLVLEPNASDDPLRDAAEGSECLGSRAAIKRGADNEDEDLDGDYQHGQTGRP